MKAGIQTFFKNVGDYACLVFCIIKIAETYTGKQFDPVAVISIALEKKWLDEDMYVRYPEEFMSYLCGGRWAYEHANILPSGQMNEIEFYIERWEWAKKPNEISNHFRLKEWDSLEDSQTVKYGQIVSYRILRKIS